MSFRSRFNHEVLEGAVVAVAQPPASVREMNEADFESAARRMHAAFGIANPERLQQMLEEFGF